MYSNETDGFKLAGGATSRELALSGGNVSMIGGGVDINYFVNPADVVSSQTIIINAFGAPLLSNKTYLFRFRVIFKTAAYTTGIFLSVNGPTASAVSINTLLPLANTTNMAPSHLSAYDGGVVATGAGTAAADANKPRYAEVTGMVTTTAAGDLYLRFNSEVNGSAATVMAGSLLELIRVV